MRALKFGGIALSVGLVMGGAVGWHLGGTVSGGQSTLREMSAAAGYGQLAVLQDEQADTEHARQALLAFTNFSRSMRRLHSAQGDQALLIDTGRTYLQLAAIEELADNNSLSHQYVLDAQQTFLFMGRNIPEQDLDQQVAKIVASARLPSPPS